MTTIQRIREQYAMISRQQCEEGWEMISYSTNDSCRRHPCSSAKMTGHLRMGFVGMWLVMGLFLLSPLPGQSESRRALQREFVRQMQAVEQALQQQQPQQQQQLEGSDLTAIPMELQERLLSAARKVSAEARQTVGEEIAIPERRLGNNNYQYSYDDYYQYGGDDKFNQDDKVKDYASDVDSSIDLTGYALKYVGCQNTQSYSSERASSGASSPLQMDRFAILRLCERDSCSSYNRWGCSSYYGEYALPMEDYLSIMVKYHLEQFNKYCETCSECMTFDNTTFWGGSSSSSKNKSSNYQNSQSSSGGNGDDQYGDDHYYAADDDYYRHRRAQYGYNNRYGYSNSDNGRYNNNYNYGYNNGGYNNYNYGYNNNNNAGYSNNNGGYNNNYRGYNNNNGQYNNNGGYNKNGGYNNNNGGYNKNGGYNNNNYGGYSNNNNDGYNNNNNNGGYNNKRYGYNNNYNNYGYKSNNNAQSNQKSYPWYVADGECMYQKVCNDYSRACKTYKPNTTYYEDYFSCSSFSFGNQKGYLGPHCRSDGHTIGIGIYEDEECNEYIGDTVDISTYTSQTFDDGDLVTYYDKQCISCDATESFSLVSDTNYGTSGETYPLCSALFTTSAKCNRKMRNSNLTVSEQQVENEESVCDYITSLIENNFDETGEIQVQEYFSFANWNKGGEYEKLVRRASSFQIVALIVTISTTLGLIGYSMYLHKKLTTRVIWLPPSRVGTPGPTLVNNSSNASNNSDSRSVEARSEAGRLSRINSGIMALRSKSIDGGDSVTAPPRRPPPPHLYGEYA